MKERILISGCDCMSREISSDRQLLIIGAGGHGKVVADIASRCGYDGISFLDDNGTLKSCMGYSVVGKSSDAEKYKGCDFFVAIGNPKTREKVLEKLQREQLDIATLIHPDAVIADSVSIGIGTAVMAGTVINPDSVIGNGCMIGAGTVVFKDIDEPGTHIGVPARKVNEMEKHCYFNQIGGYSP